LRCIPRGGLNKTADRLDTIAGTPPALGSTLPGCVFVDRCTIAQDKCRTSIPELIDVGSNHFSRCYFHEQLMALGKLHMQRQCPSSRNQCFST
jgi:peptide/nickel transport system ATP-binding protein